MPDIYTSPPLTSDQLVNLPMWLGVNNWTPQRASATQAGLTVTVVATPRSVTWRMGVGDPVVCYSAGARYNVNVRDENQSTDCSFTYPRSSADQPDLKYATSATMNWTVTWSASNGDGGNLGTGTRTTNFHVRVAEGQALVVSSG